MNTQVVVVKLFVVLSIVVVIIREDDNNNEVLEIHNDDECYVENGLYLDVE